jgi:hypothetical protein
MVISGLAVQTRFLFSQDVPVLRECETGPFAFETHLQGKPAAGVVAAHAPRPADGTGRGLFISNRSASMGGWSSRAIFESYKVSGRFLVWRRGVLPALAWVAGAGRELCTAPVRRCASMASLARSGQLTPSSIMALSATVNYLKLLHEITHFIIESCKAGQGASRRASQSSAARLKGCQFA